MEKLFQFFTWYECWGDQHYWWWHGRIFAGDLGLWFPSSTSFIVHVLHSPTPSQLAHKRKIHCTHSPYNWSKVLQRRTSRDPKGVKPLDRVWQYPGGQLVVPAGKLFCSACREEVSTKKSIIQWTCTSSQLRSRKGRIGNVEAKNEQSVVKALKCFDSHKEPVGEFLPDSSRVFRVKVVTSFLKVGISLSKLVSNMNYSNHGYSLSSSTHLHQLLPFILHEEVARIEQQISGRSVSIVFMSQPTWRKPLCSCCVLLLTTGLSNNEVWLKL